MSSFVSFFGQRDVFGFFFGVLSVFGEVFSSVGNILKSVVPFVDMSNVHAMISCEPPGAR